MRSFNHGINTPVFSLRTESSGGIGEYLDLIPLIDWLAAHGFDTLQILPINDSGNDASPYNLQSAFALNPLLIKWPELDSKGLNSLKSIDYDAVRELKEKKCRELRFTDQEVDIFVAKHPWVTEYAAAKDQNKSLFEQIMCYKQMKLVKAHADKRGVKLMGDLPILIARDSVDVKLHPEQFLTQFSAGSPPDMFNLTGQNWGFPIYNWAKMEQDDFSWWSNRLAYASEFYHSYRLDHIVGFYRMWATYHNQDLPGFFVPYEEEKWIPQGELILRKILLSSFMEPIGEDLGVVPDSVRASLARLKIAGTKVLRWERYWHGNKEFIPFDQYPENSLATVSTHDAPPLRLWWQTEKEEQREWARFEGWDENTPLTPDKIARILKQSHQANSRYSINLLLEYLSAIPTLRWDNPEDDLINRPGISSPENWTWRMKPSLEEMAASEDLSKMIRSILT